jgi:hypothetical protein
MGDSFTFGEGLADDQTLAAQFARETGFKMRTVNLGLSGYAPNQLVRAFEVGALDRFANQNVKWVVAWIIPAQIARVGGEASWLGSSPRYELRNGAPHYTGTFNEHRLSHPWEGLVHYAGEQFAFVKAIGAAQREREQADLFVALILRLRDQVREKLGAQLYVVYSWADYPSPTDPAMRVRMAGIPTLWVNSLVGGYKYPDLVIPHDGHPNAFQVGLIAEALRRRLLGP